MTKNKEKSNGSPLMGLDLDDLVKGARASDFDLAQEEATTTVPTEVGTESTPTSSSPASWESFLAHSRAYKSKNKPHSRNVYIEHDILDVFRNCSIEKATVPSLVNAALRVFIETHKQELKTSLRPIPTLIKTD